MFASIVAAFRQCNIARMCRGTIMKLFKMLVVLVVFVIVLFARNKGDVLNVASRVPVTCSRRIVRVHAVVVVVIEFLSVLGRRVLNFLRETFLVLLSTLGLFFAAPHEEIVGAVV